MGNITKFKHKQVISLRYESTCTILAVDQNQFIYLEEYYDDSYVAQHCIMIDGKFITTHDELSGQQEIDPISIPPAAMFPHQPLQHPLNMTGLRFRGMREQDQVASWVKAIPMLEKMPLLQKLDLGISPMMVMGIAESRVLATTALSPEIDIVCRRIRLLYALPQAQKDVDGLPYDYETILFHVLHIYNHQTDTTPPLHEALETLPHLTNPTDCLFTGKHLIVANSGQDSNRSEVHIFEWHDQEL